MNTKFWDFIKSLGRDLAIEIAKKVCIAIVPSGIAFGGILSLCKHWDFPVWATITLCIILTASVAFLALLLIQIVSSRYTKVQKIESEYEILEKTVSFRFDGTRCYYRSEMTLLFKKKATEYYGKYFWSGSGAVKISPENRFFRFDALKRRNRYVEYVILFDRLYKKGEKLTFTLHGEMNDPRGRFAPYFSTKVDTPTRKLKIKLHIDPQKYPITSLEQEIIPPIYCAHENCEQVSLDESGTYIWEIDNPELAYQYSLNWTFE